MFPRSDALFLSLSSRVFFLLLRCLSLTPVPRWYFLVITSSACFFASWTPSFAVTFIASYTWNPAVPFILSLFFLFFLFSPISVTAGKNKQTKTSPHLFLPGQQMSSRVLGKHIRGFDSEWRDGQVDASRRPEFSVLKEQQKDMFYKLCEIIRNKLTQKWKITGIHLQAGHNRKGLQKITNIFQKLWMNIFDCRKKI